MLWWMWVLLGLALLGVEIITPGAFFFFFFGIAALVVGGLVALGLGGPAWLPWLLFTTLAVALFVALRSRLVNRLSETPPEPLPEANLIGDRGVLTEDLPDGGEAKVEVRGSSWRARSTHAGAWPAGTRCRVERIDGLTLWIRPDPTRKDTET